MRSSVHIRTVEIPKQKVTHASRLHKERIDVMIALTHIFVTILGAGQVYLAYSAPTEYQLERRTVDPEPVSTFTVDVCRLLPRS